jgi:CubicO group peptidase (beta-lactamase class C family)
VICTTLVIIVILTLTISFIVYPSEYVLRVFTWLSADVYDYERFPERPIKPSAESYHFAYALDENRVRDLFEENHSVSQLESILTETGTQAFLVIKDDAILYEGHFNGATSDSIVTSFSMAKSFTSALIGIAIDEGYITSVEDPITKYIPELLERDIRFANISIHDLLRMSSGIKYVETSFINGDDAKTYYYPDLRQLAIDGTEIVAQPGESFLYNNYHPLLLGLIIERSTGQTVTQFLQDKIWVPIGMQYPASWSLDSERSGFEKMESGINARAVDFAKFGRLFLENGQWFGRQVISPDWIAVSAKPDNAPAPVDYYPSEFIFEDGKGYYQYMWWGIERPEGEADFFAIGNYGQFIYVSPDKKLIIVRNGENYGIEALDWINLFYQFASQI